MATLVEYGTRCLYENTNFYSVLIVRSASWLKLKSSHFWKCCEETFYLCVRLMQNHKEIFSTTAKLFVWRLRLRVQKAQSPHYWHMGDKIKNLLTNINIWELYWILSSLRRQRHSETTAIKMLCSKQAASLFSRCSNAVKNVGLLFRSFWTPIYASQIWWNFRKSRMQKLRVAYNFGCRALYSSIQIPWRASVNSRYSSGSM